MSSILIEGVANTTALARGERAEVEKTEHVERLLELGYVKEVRTVDRVETVKEVPQTDDGAAAVAPAPATVENPPTRNQSTQTWLDYVRGLGIEEPDDASREKLQADYDEYRAALLDG